MQEQHSGEFPWFYFCVIYVRLGAEEARKLETPKSIDKNVITKA